MLYFWQAWVGGCVSPPPLLTPPRPGIQVYPAEEPPAVQGEGQQDRQASSRGLHGAGTSRAEQPGRQEVGKEGFLEEAPRA